MRLPPSHHSLDTLDAMLGSDTRTAFRAASSLHPQIRRVNLRLTSGAPGYDYPESFSDQGTIKLPDSVEFYEAQLSDPIMSIRLAHFAEFFKIRRKTFTAAHVGEVMLLHELGHAVDFWKSARTLGKSRASQLNAYRLDGEIAGLPLGMPTTHAIRLGQENVKGFRTSDFGDKSEQWQAALAANMAAYAQLPSEVAADKVALGVLAHLHPVQAAETQPTEHP